ncbi:hypothetical protein [Agromyces subbeticus]|uniref:hypothetical protein n=1 Tax=Agromyces subbeticus TaxID=293890 RepID=UPI0003B78375|nr:hypothetical protein [Agromyces subbeticus]
MPTAAAPSRRAATGVTVSVVIAIVGALLSYKIGGRFALSNVAQIVAVVVLFASLPRLLRARDVMFLLLGFAGVLLAAVLVSNEYGYRLAPEFSAYYGLAALWLLGIYRACRTYDAGAAVAQGFRWAIPFALVYLLLQLGLDLSGGTDRRRLGFDDKSHASVYASFLAFAALRFLPGRARLLVSLVFLIVAFLTISRLPFVFAPVYVLAFLVEYRKVRAEARTPLEVYFAHLTLAGTVLTPLVLAAQAAGLFRSFDRFFGSGEFTNASTTAHLLLLQYAAQLKIDTVGNMLFGITPGGFAGVLSRSDIDVGQFAMTDPPGYEKLLEGTAPMHSSLGSIVLEFPLWVSVAYLVLVAWAFLRLYRNREWVMLCFLTGFFAATIFYSSQTELYFCVAWTSIIAVAAASVPTPSDSGGRARRSPPRAGGVRW